MKGKHITTEEREAVIKLLKTGVATVRIAKTLNLCDSTVRKIKYETGSLPNQTEYITQMPEEWKRAWDGITKKIRECGGIMNVS